MWHCLRFLSPVLNYNSSIKDNLNVTMQRTANGNAADLRRICNRSEQPKIETLENNVARLILHRKLDGTESQELQP